MANKTHFTVVRNQGYRSTEFKTRQRHNERQNENYYNGDIVPERSELNVRYQRYLFPDGTPETYEDSFSRMLTAGTIAKRGLKPDAKVFAELVFDVNTAYFEESGGYDYAVKFFDEAYRMAINEVGDARYILSAVMHADEKNVALSEHLGRDVFHYHLHVAYIPVVEKKVYYRKDCKDAEKAGTLKEVIPQISHSKKWPIKTLVERDGKTININSYSLLQDRYFDHMRTAGFTGFERGERGSTVEHLDVLDYKIQQDIKRLADVSAQIEKKEVRRDKLDEQIAVKQKAKATITEVEAMGKPAILGGFNVTADEMKKLKSLAKATVKTDERIAKLKRDMADLQDELNKTKQSLMDAKLEANHWHREFTELWNEVKDFIGAIRKFPSRLREFVSELFRPEREQQRQQKHFPQKSHNREVSR